MINKRYILQGGGVGRILAWEQVQCKDHPSSLPLRIQVPQNTWIPIYFIKDLNSSFNLCSRMSLIEQAQAISNPTEQKHTPFSNIHVSDPQQPSRTLYKKTCISFHRKGSCLGTLTGGKPLGMPSVRRRHLRDTEVSEDQLVLLISRQIFELCL